MTHDAPSKARIEPLTTEAWSDEQRALLEGPFGDDVPNLFATLALNVPLYEKWFPFCMKLLGSSAFPRRERELVILRTAALCHQIYEWRQHVILGRRAKITDAELAALAGHAPGSWTPREQALLDAVDDLDRDHAISDLTWGALVASGCTQEQLIELPMLIGHYQLLAGVMASLNIQLDDNIADADVPDPAVRPAGH